MIVAPKTALRIRMLAHSIQRSVVPDREGDGQTTGRASRRGPGLVAAQALCGARPRPQSATTSMTDRLGDRRSSRGA
jgi:hypothetical protein